MELRGARVVITGGSTGIGRAVAGALLDRGAKVVIAARRADRLDDAVRNLSARADDVVGVPTDITKQDQVHHLAEVAWDTLGGVDLALFNAGSAAGDQLLDPDIDAWRSAFEVHVFGLLHCIKAFVPRLVEQGNPAAVYATTSGAGIHGTAYNTAPYAAAKNAQLTIMESLYGQARDRGVALRVGVLVPPLTRTNLAGDDLSIWDVVEASLSKGDSPTRLIEPEEYAELVVAGVEQERFWIEPTLEDDERFFAGRYAPTIRRTRGTIERRAQAMINHLPPDEYLW